MNHSYFCVSHSKIFGDQELDDIFESIEDARSYAKSMSEYLELPVSILKVEFIEMIGQN